jgi:hypothetical protein
VDRDQAAYGFNLRAPNSSGLKGAIGYKEIQENFKPALGFVNRAGVRDLTVEAGYTLYTQSPSIRKIFSGVDFERIETIAGELQSQYVTLRVIEVERDSGDGGGFHYYITDENLDAPFEISEGVIIPAGQYSFDTPCVGFGTADYRKLAIEGFYCDGDFYDGTQVNYHASALWRPNKHFQLTAILDVYDTELPYGAFITRLISLRADIAFTNSLYWENFVQYDNESDSLGLNSILRYQPTAGREAALIVNREYVDFSQDRTFTKVYGDIAFKISYTFRF